MTNPTQKKRSVIIDCDPGVDDAVMLVLALGAPELDVTAITTVAGNVPIALTSRNARILTDLMHRTDVPVFAGCPAPLLRSPVTAEDFHGNSGLEGIDIFVPATPLQDNHAVTFLVQHLKAAPARSVSLLVTGPMTNIAAALALDPTIAGAVEQCIIMGGAHTEGGNITPHAEFNIFADPHAAARVLSSDLPVTMLSLDVTHTLRAEDDRMAELRKLRSDHARLVVRLLDAANSLEGRWKPGNRAPLHDPSTLIYLLRPDLFSVRNVTVQVDASDMLSATFGQTRLTIEDGAVNWVARADADGVFAYLGNRLARGSAT